MDEIDNASNIPEEQPFPDFTPEPPRSNTWLKVVIGLVVVGLIVAFLLLGGKKRIVSWYENQPAMTQTSTKLLAWKSDSPFASLAIPSDIRLIGAYRTPLKIKGLTVFLAAPEKDPLVLPKELTPAMELGAHKGAVYYLISTVGADTPLDNITKTVGDLVRQQGKASTVQDKIWISGQETPALVEDVVKGDTVFQLVTLRIPNTGALLAVTPSAAVERAPHRAMIAALFGSDPDKVSFTVPEPAGMKWARQILSTDVDERKKAVPMLVAVGGEQPEAVAFLADAFKTASAAVKVDIVAALGLLAPTTPQAVQPLLVALKDKPSRLEAMAALGSLGTSAKEALPALKKIAFNKKEPKNVRAAANTAIAKIAGQPLTTPAPKKKKKKAR